MNRAGSDCEFAGRELLSPPECHRNPLRKGRANRFRPDFVPHPELAFVFGDGDAAQNMVVAGTHFTCLLMVV